MDVTRYLQRIGYSGEVAPTAEVLSKLQIAHLLSVPFENLDIHSDIKIDLRNSYHKIVLQNRGGFCYELNGLFYQLLKNIGYQVKMISARAFDKKKGYGPEFDHMAIIARIDDKNYLVDVGFGEFALYPLKMEFNTAIHDPRGTFKVETCDQERFVVKKMNPGGKYIPEYLFSEIERRMEEFDEMCHYHQTSSESHFTQKRICSLPIADGRMTLTGNVFKITTNGTTTEKWLHNETEVQKILRDHFKINLSVKV